MYPSRSNVFPHISESGQSKEAISSIDISEASITAFVTERIIIDLTKDDDELQSSQFQRQRMELPILPREQRRRRFQEYPSHSHKTKLRRVYMQRYKLLLISFNFPTNTHLSSECLSSVESGRELREHQKNFWRLQDQLATCTRSSSAMFPPVPVQISWMEDHLANTSSL